MKTNQIIDEKSQFRAVVPLKGATIETKDGKTVGKCGDFLFDDENWTIRYIVANTGGFFSRNEVLMSPFVFKNPEFGNYHQSMQTVLSEDWIESSPPLEAHSPVSRKYELELARHFGYPLYWTGTYLWGGNPHPMPGMLDPNEPARHEEKMAEIGESRLRSCDEVVGYEVISNGESIGKVDDFIVETHPWRIRYLVVRTGNWMFGKRVILSPEWVADISWEENEITMTGPDREQIESAPAFDPSDGVNRDYEGRLYDYYGRRYYW
ncbi:MAG: PRC-barrel domain-containing protein [Verrucomicrobiales bacterium]|nr:PRC-barrel domain-containing protein [Verrucomicrobiales bacterium]